MINFTVSKLHDLFSLEPTEFGFVSIVCCIQIFLFFILLITKICINKYFS